MANIKSAEKRIRQTHVRTKRNKSRISRVRTFIRKLERDISSGDKGDLKTAFSKTMSEIHLAVKHKVLRKGTANRKISRLNARIKNI